MATEGTKRIRIAVAITLNGNWIAYGMSGTGTMTEDDVDERNKWRVDRELQVQLDKSPYRINMVEATVILPILENKNVVVQAD